MYEYEIRNAVSHKQALESSMRTAQLRKVVRENARRKVIPFKGAAK